MPVNTPNLRRSASSAGLVTNLTPPIPDHAISDSNSDGSDLRHIADIYRRPVVNNPEGGVTTIIVFGSFGIDLSTYPNFNLKKDNKTNIDLRLDQQLLQTLTKTTTIGLSSEENVQFTPSSKKVVSTNLGTDLNSQFVPTTSTIIVAPQISFSLIDEIRLSPHLLTVVSAFASLSIDNYISLINSLSKLANVNLGNELNSQFTSSSVKTVNTTFDIIADFVPQNILTKTISVGLSTALSFSSFSTFISGSSVRFGLDLSSTYSNILTKTASVGIGLDQGVFISGWNKSTVLYTSFGINLNGQFRSNTPTQFDLSPSTFCFTLYICKEIDFTSYITKEIDFDLQLKHRC